MSKREYHEVGEVFEFKGQRLKVIESESLRCGQCALSKEFLSCEPIACAFSERKDRTNVIFVAADEPLTKENHIGKANEMISLLKRQLAVLKEIMQTYPGKTIDNIVMQMEARIKEMKKGDKQ